MMSLTVDVQDLKVVRDSGNEVFEQKLSVCLFFLICPVSLFWLSLNQSQPKIHSLPVRDPDKTETPKKWSRGRSQVLQNHHTPPKTPTTFLG